MTFIFLGDTRTDLALKMAYQELFCNQCGNRANVTKILLVVTDGKSSSSSGNLRNAAQPLMVGTIKQNMQS